MAKGQEVDTHSKGMFMHGSGGNAVAMRCGRRHGWDLPSAFGSRWQEIAEKSLRVASVKKIVRFVEVSNRLCISFIMGHGMMRAVGHCGMSAM